MRLKNTAAEIQGLDTEQARFVAEYMRTFKVPLAAEKVGLSVEEGYKLLRNPVVKLAIDAAYGRLFEDAMIDGAWLLNEMVHNHFLARQTGNLSASNASLALIAKHAAVDAFSPERIEVAGDKERVARLLRGRERARNPDDRLPGLPPEVSFL